LISTKPLPKSTNLNATSQLALVDGDIGDSATAQKVADTAIERFGRIDVLVNLQGRLQGNRDISCVLDRMHLFTVAPGSGIVAPGQNRDAAPEHRVSQTSLPHSLNVFYYRALVLPSRARKGQADT
jgi:NAD(P)-dependent dehydrogenase (short-subunit alcohol dehydrogenase family)